MASLLALLLLLPLGVLAIDDVPEAEEAADEWRGAVNELWEPRAAVEGAARGSRASSALDADADESAPAARRLWDRSYPSCLATAAGGALARRKARWWYSSYSPQDTTLDPSSTLTIAATVSMNQSDKYGGFGHWYLKAYDLFMDMLAEELGTIEIAGRQHSVELIVMDDFSDEAYTEEVYKALTQCVTPLLLGPYSSTLTMPAARVAQESGAMMVAPGASNTMVFANRSNIFGTSLPGQMVVPPALEEVANHGARTVSYVYEDVTGTRAICSGVDDFSQRRQLTILGRHVITSSNVNAVVRNMKQERPDVVVACTYDQICHELIAEMRRESLDAKAFIMPICAPSPVFLESTGHAGQYMMGLLPRGLSLPLAPGGRVITEEMIVERWKQHHSADQEPTFQALGAFLGISTLFLAVQYANTTEAGAVAAALSNLAEVSFDSNRQRLGSPDVVQYTFSAVNGQVIAPNGRKEANLWYPRPRWQDMICYDTRSQPHYLHRGVANTTERECTECPAGRVSTFSESGMRTCQECGPGEALRTVWQSGQLFDASCIACAPGMMGVNGTCAFCPTGKFQNLSMQTACHDCLAGRFSKNVASTACASCEIAEDSLDSSSETFYNTQAGSTECFACPTGGLCDRQADGLYSSITNKDEYYMMPNTPPGEQAKVYWCPHGEGKACLSHDRCYEDESGEPAMEGPMCGKCRPGYGRVHDPFGLCEKCAGKSGIIGSLLFHSFLVIVLVGFLLYMVFATDFSNPRHLHLIIIRQFLNYVQLALIVTESHAASASISLNHILKFIGYGAGEGGLSMFSLSCLSWKVFPGVDFFKVAQVIGLATMPSLVVLLCVGYGLLCCVAALLRMKVPDWRRLVALIIVVLYIATSSVTRWLLVSLLCHPYDVPRLVLDPSVKCGAPEHRMWEVASASGFALFSVGVPLAFYFVLLYYQRRRMLHNPEVLQMVGFLSSGFEPQYWYFECIFMLRELLFIFIPRLPGLSSEDPQLNANIRNYMLVVVSGPFLTLQLYCQPFDNRGSYILDRIEDASLLAVLMTPLLQVVVWQGQSSTQSSPLGGELGGTLCLIIIALLHCRVVMLVLWGFVRHRVMSLAPRFKNRNRWYSRLAGLVVPQGQARLDEEKMDFFGVSGTCEALLGNIIEDIVRLHITQLGTVTYMGIERSLRDIVAMAQRVRDEETECQLTSTEYYLKLLDNTVNRLPLVQTAARGAAQNLETILRKRMIRLTRKQPQKRPGQSFAARQGAVNSPASGSFVDDLPLSRLTTAPDLMGQRPGAQGEFAEVQTRGRLYSIEELQEALMRLSHSDKKFCSVYSCPEEFSRQSLRPAMEDSGSFDWEEIDEEEREALETLEAELKDTWQESKVLRAALEREIEENERLRAAVQKAQSAEMETGEPKGERSGGQQAEAPRQVVEAEEVAASGVPGDSAAAPRNTGEQGGRASQEKPEQPAEDGVGQAATPGAGAQQDRRASPGRPAAEATKDGAGPEPSPPRAVEESGAQDGAASSPERAAGAAADADAPCVAAAAADAAQSDGELDAPTEDGGNPFRWGLMQEEKRVLLAERDDAVLRLEHLELAMHRSQLELRRLQGELAAEAEEAEEAEARLLLAQAENASLHRWADAIRKDGEVPEPAAAGSAGGGGAASARGAPPEPPQQEAAAGPQPGVLRNAFLASCATKDPFRGSCTAKSDVAHVDI